MSNDLMAKLAISKKIMDKHQEISRGNANGTTNYNAPMVENYEAVPATYNIPQEYASETTLSEVSQPILSPSDNASLFVGPYWFFVLKSFLGNNFDLCCSA